MGRTEEGSGIQIVQEDTELRNTGKHSPPTPDLLQTPNEGCPPALDLRVT